MVVKIRLYRDNGKENGNYYLGFRVEDLGLIWVFVTIMGPFWIPIYNTAPNIQGTQKGTINIDHHPNDNPLRPDI